MDEIETQPFSEIFGYYLGMLWHWAWLLILVTALAGGAAYYTSNRTTPVYLASTIALVDPAPSNRSPDYTTVITSQALAQTYIELVTARPILEGVIAKLGLDLSPDVLKGAIQAEAIKDTQLIVIKVEDTDPERAARIANTLFDEFSKENMAAQATRYATAKESLSTQLAELDQQIKNTSAALNRLGVDSAKQTERDQLNMFLSQYRQTYSYLLQSSEQLQLTEAQSISTVTQKEPAIPPKSPIRPQTMRNTILAALVGLMLGIGVVILIESLDDTVKGPEDIARKLKLPILGAIAHIESSKDASLVVTLTRPLSPISESFRSLRTNIQYLSVDHPISTLLVTSPTPEDGKSTIVANLGVVLAQAGNQAVIMDVDLRKPMIHRMLALTNRRGISDYFVEPQARLDGNLQATTVEGLRVLTSGSLPPNPSELLGSQRMLEIMKDAKAQADVIILDSPPLLSVTDAAVLAARVDGVLLVVRPGVTQLAACRLAKEHLMQVGAKILGVVLNEVDVNRSRYRYGSYYKGYYSHYGYSSSYQYDDGKRPKRKKRN